ncbi:MAG: hypothetical protein LBG15_02390 [Dysgonamonadaceae bacterium]|nr:hypothetical protein [Dysgonamonadaceae bacterium]
MIVIFVILFSITKLPLYSQPNLGIEIGGVYNDFVSSNTKITPEFSYRIGGFINYDNIFGSGIFFVKKNIQISEFIPQYVDYIQNLDVSINSIELVPIYVKWKPFNVNKIFKIIPFLSLYGHFDFSGTGYLTGFDKNNQIFNKQVNLFQTKEFIEGGENYTFKKFQRFDIGARIGIDFVYNDKYIFRLDWSRGAFNLSSYDKRIQSQFFNFSLCYLLRISD